MVFDPRGVMTQNQFADLRQRSNLRRVRCGRVLHFLAPCSECLQERGLVIKRPDAFDDRDDLLAVHRIGAVRVAFLRLITERAIFILDTVSLFEEKTASRHPVLERDGLHGNGAVLEDHLVFAGVDGMEDDVVETVVGVIVQQRRKQFLQIRMGVDMHRLGAFEHAERRQQPDETETMVSMEMGDEDIIQPPGVNTEPLHGQQHSFAAIDEEGLVAQLHQLPRWGSGFCRLCAAAT